MGLATAAGGAALADMVDSIKTRFPDMPIVHAPCLVQGEGAVTSICEALDELDANEFVDVICGRAAAVSRTSGPSTRSDPRHRRLRCAGHQCRRA